MENIVNSRKEIGDYIFVSKYARTVHGKKETWDQSIDRVMEMHWRHLADDMTVSDSSLDDLSKEMSFAEKLYRNQVILGAQRALQYGGDTLLKHHARNYNCAGSYANRISFFQELMYLLLCGSGTGYSVQKVHVNQLPKMKGVDMSKQTTYVIDDSIEGWSHAVNALIESHYFGLPEVVFDSSRVRPKGAFITGGFRAPGPEPLMKCLSKMGKVLGKIRGRKATPFEVHRLACLIADAVISGGIRRSALLCQFDADDREMLTCKTGGWFSEFPELARANNSAIILPSTPKEVYENIFSSIKQFGEPGIIFSFHPDIVYNPCVEVSGYPQIEINGEIQYGWFFCNLTEINGSKIKTKEEFFDACRGASVLGTIQASYTSFKVLTKASRLIAERDALIGCSLSRMLFIQNKTA